MASADSGPRPAPGPPARRGKTTASRPSPPGVMPP